MPEDNQEQEHPAITAAKEASEIEDNADIIAARTRLKAKARALSKAAQEREERERQTIEQDLASQVEADMATAPDIDVRTEFTNVDMPRIGKVLSQTTARETMELDLDRSEVTEILRNYACRLMGLPADEAPNISFKFRENTGNFVLTYVKESHSYG